MTVKSTTSRRRFVQGATASAAIAPFFINRPAHAWVAEHKMKAATVAPAGTVWADLMTWFKSYIKEVTDGRIKVSAYLGGSLGGELETAQRTKKGTIQAFGGTFGALAGLAPGIDCMELPYLFPSGKKAYGALRKSEGNVRSLLEANDFKFLFYSQNGFRSVGTSAEIDSVSALKGKKMRSQQNKVHELTWKKVFEAAPQMISVTEVYQSLESGVVDGYDNTALFAFAASWYKATKQFTLTEHIFQPAGVVLSKKWFDTLPADLQAKLEMVDDKVKEKEVAAWRQVALMSGQLIQNFRDAKVKVVKPSASEIASLKSKKSAVYKAFSSKTSPAGRDLLKAIQKHL